VGRKRKGGRRFDDQKRTRVLQAMFASLPLAKQESRGGETFWEKKFKKAGGEESHGV